MKGEGGFRMRLVALVRKETRQLLRDRSNLAVGLLLPVLLILLFGYGLSFDLSNARVAVVLEEDSPASRNLAAALGGTRYITPVLVRGMPQAEQALREGRAKAILRVPVDYSRQLAQGRARVQLLLNGADSTMASAIETYVNGAIATRITQETDRRGTTGPDTGAGPGTVAIVQRMWFNESGNSRWYLVPGLIVLVLTLIGAFLTALLVARERERGTLEALFVTPVRPLELVLAKLAPYLVVGAIDLVFCLLAAHFLFGVPMRGSLWVILLASGLYLLVSLALGLYVSGQADSQFQASQVALIASFMPATMLSGFVFDIRNLPAPVQVVSHAIPATHFMQMIKTLFLGGNDWPMVVRECAILAAYAIVLVNAARLTLRKRLD